MLRVKNEARWIRRCLDSILPLCDKVFVMDDHSTDDTLSICRSIPKVEAFASPFEGLNEARDKNQLLDIVELEKPTWIIAIDGDEVVSPGTLPALRAAMNNGARCLSLRILYLWDREDQVRMDGVYGDFHRESIFRPNGARFLGADSGPNFHCGNVPSQLRQKRVVLDIPLLHFGYMNREDRIRKYEFYNQQDRDNAREDHYRHMVIGDLFPAESKFKHGGPLQLRAIN